jgi:hypothetical protein
VIRLLGALIRPTTDCKEQFKKWAICALSNLVLLNILTVILVINNSKRLYNTYFLPNDLIATLSSKMTSASARRAYCLPHLNICPGFGRKTCSTYVDVPSEFTHKKHSPLVLFLLSQFSFRIREEWRISKCRTIN